MASGDYQQRRIMCRPKNPSCLIKKLSELIYHPISGNATHRHLHILDEFLNATLYGFYLHDIPHIISLYEILVKKLPANPEFKEPLKSLLYYSGRPPIMCKLSDKLEYQRDLQEYFSTLGYLILCLDDKELKKLVLHAVKSLLITQSPEEYWVPLEKRREAVEESKLPETFTQLLLIVSDELYPLLLDVMFVVCKISSTTCRKIITENALEFLLTRLDLLWRSSSHFINPTPADKIPFLEETCCILWQLLNVVEKAELNVEEPSIAALKGLQFAFRWSTLYPEQRANRNNLTALLLKLLILFPNLDLYSTDLSEDIELLSIGAAGCKTCADLELKDDRLDFQFKKLIWACLYFLEKCKKKEITKGNEIMKQFLEGLFETNSSHVDRHCELIKIVLRIIPKYMNYGIEDFIGSDGPLKVLRLIERYFKTKFNTEILNAYMYCLAEILTNANEDTVKVLVELKAASVTIGVCRAMVDSKALKSNHQHILISGFRSLQKLGAFTGSKNPEIVNLCVSYLHRVIRHNYNDSLLNDNVTICAIDLLWTSIIKDKMQYKTFLKNGGIYVILDLIEVSNLSVRTSALGLLADVARKGTSVPYLITWRKRGKGLFPMLLEVFRNNGEKVPICATKSVQNGCVPQMELVEKCRYKINGIINALNVTFKNTVEIANAHYKLLNEQLTRDDQLTLLFAKHFASLKLCQSWLEIVSEIKEENFAPTQSDQEYIKGKFQCIRQWQIYLQDTIQIMLDKDHQNECNQELKTYSNLNESTLTGALEALKDICYISSCTEKMFQLRKKIIYQNDIDKSEASLNIHRTICELPFTNIYNQKISIQSNTVYEKKEEHPYPMPVSSDEDVSLSSSDIEHDISEPQLEC